MTIEGRFIARLFEKPNISRTKILAIMRETLGVFAEAQPGQIPYACRGT